MLSGLLGSEMLPLLDGVGADRERGERTPFGSMRGLTAVDPGLATQVLDLRGLDAAAVVGAGRMPS